MRIDTRKIDTIIPYDANAKKHEVQWILNSIRLGLPEGLSPAAERDYIVSKLIDQPIVIDAAGVIIKGHGRLKAAKELGLTEFPCVVRDDLTPDQARLARIADNRSSEGGWDAEALSAELAELSTVFDDGAFDGLGLTNEWAQEIGAAWQEEHPANDDLPEVDDTPPVAQRGEVYACGRHRVMCGDATCAADVARLMGGERAELWLTDPPYGVSYADKNRFLNRVAFGKRIQEPISNDHLDLDEMAAFWQRAAEQAYAITSNTAAYYWFACQGGDQMMMMMMSISHAKWKVRHELIWVKNNHVLGRTDYAYKHEPILYGWKVDGTHQYYGGFQTSILEYDKPLKSELHPTMKPVALVEKLITNSSQINEIVFDSFLGSGTTLIAAESTGRRCYGMEIAPKYVDVILKRFETQTGLRPERIV